MIELDLSRKSLHTADSRYRLQYNIFSDKFIEHPFHGFSVNEEVYEWLIETVGHEFHTFRKYDRLFYNRTDVKELNAAIHSSEQWEALNPVIPTDKRVWRFSRNGLAFAQTSHATLFKLRWF